MRAAYTQPNKAGRLPLTGANSGIGFAIVQKLAGLPDEFTVIAAGRNMNRVEEAIRQLPSGTSVKPLFLDVDNEESIKAAAAVVKQEYGRLDVLVNNAGVEIQTDDVAKMFKSTFTTNLFGPVLVSAAFRSLLLASSAPQSVYVSSITGRLSGIIDQDSHLSNVGMGNVAYRASKAALNMVMLHEQIETKDTPLKVYAMCPGFVVSNLRGTSEAARTGGGRAMSPEVSADLLYGILQGQKDAEMGQLVTLSGPQPW